jgi:hypothetical protein
MAAIQSKPHSSAPSSSPPPVRVVIVGAGFAGLACARALARGWPRRNDGTTTSSPPSLEIVLLEASTDGIGGRARSATLPRTGPVELGCTWLHGAVQGNAAFEFYTEEQARDASLPALQPEKEGGEQQRWRMELLRPGEAKPLSGADRTAAVAAMAAFGDAIDAAAEDEELLKNADATVGDALRRRFDELLADGDGGDKGGDEEKQRRRLLLAESWACRERLHRAYDGFRSSDDAGAAFAADYQELEGEHLPVPGGGYAALARRLLRAAQREAAEAEAEGEKGDDDDDGSPARVALRVRLGCPVERIEWGVEGETAAAAATGRRRARVVLEKEEANKEGGGEDAAVIEADAVVVTVSLGVLQARAMATAADKEDDAAAATTPTAPLQPPPRPLFSPPLPERKQRALQLMRIGVIDKLFFEWDGIQEEEGEEGDEGGGSSDGDGDDGGNDNKNDTQPQPFPMVCHEEEEDAEGKKKDQQAPDDTVGPRKTHTATTATAAASSAASSSAAAATSWCFLWPSSSNDDDAADPSHEWGAAGRPLPESRPPFSVGAALERALACAAAGENGDDDDRRERVRRDAAQALARRWMDADAAVFGQEEEDEKSVPRWLRGLHSLRFSDGPEWIRGGAGGGEEDAPSSSSSITQARAEGSACVVWATSAAALHSETLTDEELRQGTWPALLKAFPALSRAVAAKGKKRPLLRRPPSAVARSRWGTDPRFHGSYSYPGPGATGAEAEALAEPLCVSSPSSAVPVVLFAGEHTSRRFMGTVHGAMESGEREAKRLLGVLVGKV